MNHLEYNTLMRLMDMKADLAVKAMRGMETAELEEEIDELQSILRAHLVEED
jgi:hypothetical protein